MDDGTNHCYGLAFVLLAYAHALMAGVPEARAGCVRPGRCAQLTRSAEGMDASRFMMYCINTQSSVKHLTALHPIHPARTLETGTPGGQFQEMHMSKPLYVAYFAINPYGEDVPTQAVDAARKALEDHLGGAWRVLAAKTAFEEAGGLPAYWAGNSPPSIVRWTDATQLALNAAFKVEPTRQATIEDLERLDEACIDVIPAARYAYTPNEWLVVFTAHFGMSDHCESQEQALAAARHWLTSAPGACPIAAADQQIRDSYRSRSQALESSRATSSDRHGAASALHRVVPQTNAQGAWTCN